ncbi:MAG: hypothetical protein RR326_13220, partial [Stenotrophomonas sp.]
MANELAVAATTSNMKPMIFERMIFPEWAGGHRTLEAFDTPCKSNAALSAQHLNCLCTTDH